jgi:YidC/Oxa1 family membrane protein insertase
MEQRRLIVFFAISMTIWLTWFHFVGPALIPDAFPKPPKAGPLKDFDLSTIREFAADALHPANVVDEPVVAAEVPPAQAAEQHPVKELLLGPADVPKGEKEPSDEFLLAANLTSQGAAIDFVELTEKKQYPAFDNRSRRVKVLGEIPSPLKTFALRSPEIDKLLDNSSLAQVAWEVVPEPNPSDAEQRATFRYVSPDKHWEITKRFELTRLTPEEHQQQKRNKDFAPGYKVHLKVTIRNLTDKTQQMSYALQGPVGIPLEDADNSYKYRDIRMGFLRDDGKVDESKISAADVVKKIKNKNVEISKRKLKYIGVDVLYFAALILPQADEVDVANAVVSNENREKPQFSDVSVELVSPVLKVAANGEISHEYTLFAGPKQKELISKINAIAVMDYGWFDSICRIMVWLLNMFNGLGLSYGIAIIGLTAVVRTLLLPISKHVAANQAKMKVLQPIIMAKQKELEAKYGKNTEEYMKAAQELSKEQLGLMMSGCLPLFLQLPIFIALYRTIGSSIELRMEPFLWFENLASPDALFKLPFIVPWFEWTHFNLLPCLSTGLMYVSQKLTMPPPTNEEQAQQQKMMSFMMILMGAMFFRVPSGLCIYIITTNVWSMTERWVFEHLKKNKDASATDSNVAATASAAATAGKATAVATKSEDDKPSALGGIWSRLQEAADSQRAVSRQLDNANANRNEKKKKKRS